MTRTLTALIEPILIVFLGIGVGILTVGVLMPIYNIAGQM
jgi:type II secretory pathway component PulF